MLYIIPRNGDSRSNPIMKVPVDGHFNFHFANAYEDETTNEIHIDVVWVRMYVCLCVCMYIVFSYRYFSIHFYHFIICTLDPSMDAS